MSVPTTVTNSSLWRATLGHAPSQELHGRELERLRSSFAQFRERAAHLADEIRRDLPDLTIHDISHLDALWELASQIAGNDFQLTPTEGYVLGGAILLHDLAMSVAATPGGMSALQSDARYRDLIFAEYSRKLGRNPTSEEAIDPRPDIRQSVLFDLLRTVHAENAEKLAFISYLQRNGSSIFLIEDTELRQTFGRIIGKVAHSHWWSVPELENQFTRVIGAPPWAPSEWTIDPLKIACLLRTADAAHIDARRAPSFVRAFSSISAASDRHWEFQEKLNKPYLHEDALVFTSGHSFSLNEADAWWLCLDTLRMVDRELRDVDALLAERGSQRFPARRVAGVNSPERLAIYVPTRDWLPINATVHVSDLPPIIRSIGGEELYGKNSLVPLRELIQNSSDAVRARRIYEKRNETFGEIRVSLTEIDGDAWTLEISDNGVGMSRRVLTDFLLDFGSSFWGSSKVHEEFPGLLSSGFRPTGRYGIGFFSVFMIADSIKVITRRADAAAKDTLVLEFGNGLNGRPILRPALKEERLIEGGTSVALRLIRNPNEPGGLLSWRHEPELESMSIAEICSRVAPALDVTLIASTAAGTKTVISANDWTEISSDDLIKRLKIRKSRRKESDSDNTSADFMSRVANNLRPLLEEDGTVVGRACISTAIFGSYKHGMPELSGIVAVGGLKACSLSGIFGVLLGQSTRASRDAAEPLVSQRTLALWAEQQSTLVPLLYESPEAQSDCAQLIRLCGGSTGELPIARHRGKWVSARDICSMELPNTILVIDDFTLRFEFKHLDGLELDDTVFVTEALATPVILQGDSSSRDYGSKFSGIRAGMPHEFRNLLGAVVESVAAAWKVDVSCVAKCNDFTRLKDQRVGSVGAKEILTQAVRIDRPDQG